MVKEWLEQYQPKNLDEADDALREIMQEIALAGLQRSRFFEKAAFYGGTALRIFHNLERFSENLDFSLLEVNPDFDMEPYLDATVKELEALGIKVEIRKKMKTNQSDIDSAFLKPDTEWRELVLEGIVNKEKVSSRKEIKIKIELDTSPPLGFDTEENLLLRPFSFYTKCFTLPDLFAGKMHALLFRKWGNRVKGRDWFDFEWYVKKQVPLHLEHLCMRAIDSGDWTEPSMSRAQFLGLMEAKIKAISIDRLRGDVLPFIKDDGVLEIWTREYFLKLLPMIQIKD